MPKEKKRAKTAEIPKIDLAQVEKKTVNIDEIEPNPDQPRSNFDESVLTAHAAGQGLIGQLDPVKVARLESPKGRIKYQLIDGETRWRSEKANGSPTIEAMIYPPLSREQRLMVAVASNFGRTNLSAWDTLRAVKDLRDRCGIKDPEKLAAICHRKEKWIKTQLLVLGYIPGLQEFLRLDRPCKKRLNFYQLVLLSRSTAEEQQWIVDRVEAGQGAREVLCEHFVRKRGQEASPDRPSFGQMRAAAPSFRSTAPKSSAGDLFDSVNQIRLALGNLAANSQEALDALLRKCPPEKYQELIRHLRSCGFYARQLLGKFENGAER